MSRAFNPGDEGSTSLPTPQPLLENGHEVNIEFAVLLGDGAAFTATQVPFTIEEEVMSIKFLKIKLKSLAAEAKIIRTEEDRTRNRNRLVVQPELYESLHIHRTVTVREECRATHLAYGYLRGRAYRQLEASCYAQPDWARVARMVYRYGKTGKKESELFAILKGWSKDSETLEAAA